MAFVVIDGTLIPIDRIAADRPFYSGKHRMYGMNLQAGPRALASYRSVGQPATMSAVHPACSC